MASKWISHAPLLLGLIQGEENLKAAFAPQTATQSIEQPAEPARIVSDRTSINKLYDGSTVLLVGENHASRTAAEELTENLSKLKGKGVKHLAVELPEDYQPAFDAYRDKKISREE